MINYMQLKNQLTNNFFPLVVIDGDDGYLRASALKMIEESLNLSLAEVNRIVLEQPLATQIIDNSSVMPFGSDKRLIIINDFAINKSSGDIIKIFTNYIADPNNHTCIVFNNCAKELTKITGVTHIDCSNLPLNLLMEWVTKSFNISGKTINYQAAQSIVEYCNSDMSRINNEVSKLCLCEANEITQSIVDEYVYKDLNSTTYKLIDYISQQNISLSLYTLDSLIASGEDKSLIFGAIYASYRRMFFIRTNKLPLEEIAEKLNIKPFAIEINMRLSKMYTVKQLLKALEICQNIDKSLKLDYNKDNNLLRNMILQLINLRKTI